jgi:RNA polymerase sigma factor (sigma-70 family)
MNLGKLPDKKLVFLSQNGDRAAFEELYLRHIDLVKSVTRRVEPNDRDDVIQETFLSAFLTMQRLRKPESFQSWLWGIAMNVCRQRWRIRQRMSRDQQMDLAIEDMPDTSFLPTVRMESIEHAAMIRRAMDGLSNKLRTSALLFYFEYLSIAEIAELQSISESAVKTRLHRARNILKSELTPTIETVQKERLMIQVEILDVIGDEQVIFFDRKRHRAFSVYMQKQQAVSIAASVGKLNWPRPMTFSFFVDLLRKAKVKVEKVLITELKESTFYAVVILQDGTEVDARPSDAVNFALAVDAPIFADESIFEKIGVDIPIDEEMEIEFEPIGIQAIIDEISKKHRHPATKEDLVGYIMSLQKS